MNSAISCYTRQPPMACLVSILAQLGIHLCTLVSLSLCTRLRTKCYLTKICLERGVVNRIVDNADSRLTVEAEWICLGHCCPHLDLHAELPKEAGLLRCHRECHVLGFASVQRRISVEFALQTNRPSIWHSWNTLTDSRRTRTVRTDRDHVSVTVNDACLFTP